MSKPTYDNILYRNPKDYLSFITPIAERNYFQLNHQVRSSFEKSKEGKLARNFKKKTSISKPNNASKKCKSECRIKTLKKQRMNSKVILHI